MKHCNRAWFRTKAVDQGPHGRGRATARPAGKQEGYPVLPLSPHLIFYWCLLSQSPPPPLEAREQCTEVSLLGPREGLRIDPVEKWEIISNFSQDRPFGDYSKYVCLLLLFAFLFCGFYFVFVLFLPVKIYHYV